MDNLVNIGSYLPVPTHDFPLAQLEWIFRDKISLYSNKTTRANFRSALRLYKRYLSQTSNYSESLELDPRFYLKREWDVLALRKVLRWLEATNVAGIEGYITSNTVSGFISSLRQTMTHSYEHSYIDKPVLNVSVQNGTRETALREAYSVKEYEEIFKVLSPLIAWTRGLTKTYVRTGRGRDPRIIRRKGVQRNPLLGQGWMCWAQSNGGNATVPSEDNLRWYFENVLECKPLQSTPENRKHQHFFHAAGKNGGLKTLYRRWGVSASIDCDVIMPLVVELVAETGLNVESLLSLKRDCFKEAHPLTGLPYLEYYKPRSGGEKELHLCLYDNPRESLMGLKQRQSRVIGNSITTILSLTEPLVGMASAEDKRHLFLFQPRGKRTASGLAGSVERLKLYCAQQWLRRLVREYDLRGDDRRPLIFALSRFRPTKITEMVTQGYDFFDIMAIAGHASVTTTLAYIDKLKSAHDFHYKIHQALMNIKRNKLEYERDPLPVAITRNVATGEFVFKGPVCHCKNPYDPPKPVRNSSNYHEGDACSYWNMCLSCENVLITEMNLPKLVAYRNEINMALGNLSEIPVQGELYKRLRMLLDEILRPGVLFSEESLNWACELANVGEFEVLDAFISRA